MNKFKSMSKEARSRLITYAMVIVAYLVVRALTMAGAISYTMQGLMVPITAYACMAISLNLVVGFSGELSLGHAGFMSIGGFVGVIIVTLLAPYVSVGWLRLVIAMVGAGVVAAIAGFVIGIPVMRLRGDYLAIVTLAFGEIIKNLLNNLFLGLDANGMHVSMASTNDLNMEGGKVIINGPQGAVGIETLSTFGMGIILMLITLFVVQNLIDSRSGRAIMAVRDNRIAAESVGIDTTKYRLMAFVVAAALAGMAGALYAMNFSSIVPKRFDFNTSILILVFVVLGGMGNIRGGIIAATLLTILPEKLRFIGDYRMLMYAVVLIVVMIVSNNEQLRMTVDGLFERFRRKPDDAALAGGAEGGDA